MSTAIERLPSEEDVHESYPLGARSYSVFLADSNCYCPGGAWGGNQLRHDWNHTRPNAPNQRGGYSTGPLLCPAWFPEQQWQSCGHDDRGDPAAGGVGLVVH